MRQLTDLLAYLRTKGNEAAYQEVVGELGTLVHDARVRPLLVALDSVAHVPVPDGLIAPPGREVLPWNQ
ncbi:hypothetical protein OHS33_00185 [Streptomyces sp. NBC_00536]|uniref:hypothetical protein n=1 Tax=Streptomyces sp. NBC_00536 TaxID=2975769 RepID=UPI002E800711|nr:hypothetical protein [Streptomyces sp. NBC_00536]WUC76903.1 hypothetical protein OHS33_00185 [Streptomyces sp. NBC_00536]